MLPFAVSDRLGLRDISITWLNPTLRAIALCTVRGARRRRPHSPAGRYPYPIRSRTGWIAPVDPGAPETPLSTGPSIVDPSRGSRNREFRSAIGASRRRRPRRRIEGWAQFVV